MQLNIGKLVKHISSIILKSSRNQTSDQAIKLNSIRTYNGCNVTRRAQDTLTFVTPEEPWSYCFDLPFQVPDSNREYALEITATIRSGEIGIGFLNDNGQEIQRERYLKAAQTPQTVSLRILEDTSFRHLLIRSGGQVGGGSVEGMSIALKLSAERAANGFVYTMPHIPAGKILAVTHSDRPLDEARVQLNFLQQRYQGVRFPPHLPFHELSHAKTSSPYNGTVTLWSPKTDDLSNWTLVAHYISDYKPQHACWFRGKLWVLGTEQLEVWRLDESRHPAEWVKEHEFTDPWLAGAHTLFEDGSGNLILSASGSDSVLVVNMTTFEVVRAQRLPEYLYGQNYPLSREDSVVEHYIPNDLQTTHVNCASPWQGGIAVSMLIQGAIGVFSDEGYREITRGFVGCHGVRADATNPQHLYFCDSAVGTLNLIDGTGRLLSRCNLHSSWLHDAQQIEGDIFAVAISDRNIVELVNRVTGETLGVIDGKPFGLTTQFISWSE